MCTVYTSQHNICYIPCCDCKGCVFYIYTFPIDYQIKADIFLRIIVLLFVLYHQQCQRHQQNPEEKKQF